MNCDYCGHPKEEHWHGLGGCDHHDIADGLTITGSRILGCCCTRYRRPKSRLLSRIEIAADAVRKAEEMIGAR